MQSPEDPYRPPGAPLGEAPGASTLLGALREQSTWRLVGLSIVSFGVYAAYYCRRQTQTLNGFLPRAQLLGEGLPGALIATNWLSLLLLVPYWLVDESHPLEVVSDAVDMTANVLFIAWGFAARRRMNALLGARPGEISWFHGLWTFFFTAFYFNFKVNQLGDEGVPSPERAPWPAAGGTPGAPA